MHKEEVKLFLKRTDNFLDGAKQRYQKGDWDLTCFLAEQSVQLFVKSTILEISGEFPKTQSIRKLFGVLHQLTENKAFNYDRKALLFLESANLNSRYFNFSYEKEDAIYAIEIAENVKKMVRNAE